MINVINGSFGYMMHFSMFLGKVLNRFLGDYSSDFNNQVGDTNDYNTTADNEWIDMLKTLVTIIDQFMPAIMIGVGLVGAIYVIILSVKYAKAENDDEKNEAKKKLINTVIGVVIGLLIMVVLSVWLKNSNAIAKWLGDFGSKK